MSESLAARDAFVLGAVDPAGRAVAVALAEAGATVSVTTASHADDEVFFANSVLNEAWSMGRAGAAFSTDGNDLDEILAALRMAREPLLVAMPGVSEMAWPGELATETAATLVVIRMAADGFVVSLLEEAGETIAGAENLGTTVVRLLSDA